MQPLPGDRAEADEMAVKEKSRIGRTNAIDVHRTIYRPVPPDRTDGSAGGRHTLVAGVLEGLAPSSDLTWIWWMHHLSSPYLSLPPTTAPHARYLSSRCRRQVNLEVLAQKAGDNAVRRSAPLFATIRGRRRRRYQTLALCNSEPSLVLLRGVVLLYVLVTNSPTAPFPNKPL